MNFKTCSKREIENLITNYKKIRLHSSLNLAKRESIVKSLAEKKDMLSKTALWQYLFYEIKPLLNNFEGEEKETVRQYFRFIGKQHYEEPKGIKLFG
jgi:predicted choloylglycine hydrolase